MVEKRSCGLHALFHVVNQRAKLACGLGGHNDGVVGKVAGFPDIKQDDIRGLLFVGDVEGSFCKDAGFQ